MVVMSQDQKSGAVARESTEVKTRRRYDAKYKLRILEELDAVTVRGGIGRILRREGLHSSTVTKWREKRAAGALAGVTGRKPGRKSDEAAAELKRLKDENERLLERLATIEELVEAQGKVSALLQRVSRESADKP